VDAKNVTFEVHEKWVKCWKEKIRFASLNMTIDKTQKFK